ncbi:MAG: GerMN domain-containing protein, partial [Acidimicrobiia bacterium]|nr:GerMN domain-containing protein [Acidimicrobiia bacterium]
VQRLVAMSPEAPPFPEEKMVQLETKKSRDAASPKRGIGRIGWAVAGAVAVLVLIGIPAFLLGALRFGGDDVAKPTTVVTEVPPTSAAPNTTVTPTTVRPVVAPPVAMSTTVYVLADYGDSNRPGPLLQPIAVEALDSGSDALAATLDALIDQSWQTEGVSTEIPEATRLLGVEIDGSTARVDLSSEFESGGGTASVTARIAQIVFTATRFSEVDDVLFLIEGTPVEVFSGEGLVLDGPQSRDDYQDWLPLIMIEDPVSGSELETSGSFVVSGVANTFEANLVYKVTDLATGDVVVEDFTTATCGTGCWGEFSFSVLVDAPEVTQYQIEAFEYSARDGAKVNVATAIVTVRPTGGASGAPPVLIDGDHQFGFVTGGDFRADEPADSTFQVDYAEWFTGEAATAAAIEDGEIAEGETVPNDFYIRNQNPLIRELKVADGVSVWLLDGQLALQEYPLDWLIQLHVDNDVASNYGAINPGTPYWFVLDANGDIIQMVQQYTP